jgi:hypothetical protein
MALEGNEFLTCGRVPELDGSVVAGGGDPLAIGAEGRRIDREGMALEGNKYLTRGPVQDPHVTSGEALAVGAERDEVRPDIEAVVFLPGDRVQDFHGPVAARGAATGGGDARASGLNTAHTAMPVNPRRVRIVRPVARSRTSTPLISREPGGSEKRHAFGAKTCSGSSDEFRMTVSASRERKGTGPDSI